MIHKLINEAELFVRLAAGDEKAFEIIYHHYNRRLSPFVLKMVHSQELTEEIIQDIFVHLWINRHLLAEVKYHTAYLFNIAANKTLNYIKKIGRDSRLMNAIAMGYNDASNETEERLLFKESVEIITMAVAQLPMQRRIIWEMSRNEGLSHEQIAERLHISKNTVKNQMGMAMKQIRAFMENRASIFCFATFFLLTHGK